MLEYNRSYIYLVKKLYTNSHVGNWCRLPYKGHKAGCPNIGRKTCPPTAPLVTTIFDTSLLMYLVHSEFDLQAYDDLMRMKHPTWTGRQRRNVLYWQQKSRAQLKERVEDAMWHLSCNIYTLCPEGLGVQVYATALAAGLKLEPIKNLKICRHVALIGRKKV